MKLSSWLVVFFLISLNAIFSYQVIFQGQNLAIEENNVVEMLQLGWLVVAGIVFYATRRHHALPVHYVTVPAVILCFSFIIREMSVKSIGAPEWLIFFIDGHGYKLLMAAIWIPVLTFIYKHFKCYWHLFKQLLFSTTFWLLSVAASLLLISALFDKSVIVIEHFKFYEEILEMNAYALIVVAALQLKNDLLYHWAKSQNEQATNFNPEHQAQVEAEAV